MTTLKDLRATLTTFDRIEIDSIRSSMEREAAAYRLRQFREDSGMTQKALADVIGVNQNRISQMEHGELGNAKISTLRRYIEATGGALELAVKRPDGSWVPLAVDEDQR